MEKPQTVLLPAKEVLVPMLTSQASCEKFSPDFPMEPSKRWEGVEEADWKCIWKPSIGQCRRVPSKTGSGKSIQPPASVTSSQNGVGRDFSQRNSLTRRRVCVGDSMLLLLLFLALALVNKIRKCAHKLLTFEPYRTRAYSFFLHSFIPGRLHFPSRAYLDSMRDFHIESGVVCWCSTKQWWL